MATVLGLDIGGSTTRGRVAADGVTVAEGSADSASFSAAGPDAAGAALRAVLAQLGPALPGPPDAVCAGAAGAELGGGARWLDATLRELTGAPRVEVVQDVALLLPAAGLRTGIAVVCGTGSIAYGRHGDRVARAGGWGYLLGDEGGGYRLVIEAVRVVLGRRDRGEPLGPLHLALVDGGDLDSLLADLYADPRPRRWAARAPALLQSGDPALDAILRDGATAVAAAAAAVAARLDLRDAPIVLAGGLLATPDVQDAVRRALAAALPGPGWSPRALHAPPVAGAVALAQRLAERDSGVPASRRSTAAAGEEPSS